MCFHRGELCFFTGEGLLFHSSACAFSLPGSRPCARASPAAAAAAADCATLAAAAAASALALAAALARAPRSFRRSRQLRPTYDVRLLLRDLVTARPCLPPAACCARQPVPALLTARGAA